MELGRRTRILLWTVGVGLAVFVLELKGPIGFTRKAILELAEDLGIACLIGFSLGLTFATPVNRLEQWLKPLIAAIPFGIVGAFLGHELSISAEHPVASIVETIHGAIWGGLVGVVVGALVSLEAHRKVAKRADACGDTLSVN